MLMSCLFPLSVRAVPVLTLVSGNPALVTAAVVHTDESGSEHPQVSTGSSHSDDGCGDDTSNNSLDGGTAASEVAASGASEEDSDDDDDARWFEENSTSEDGMAPCSRYCTAFSLLFMLNVSQSCNVFLQTAMTKMMRSMKLLPLYQIHPRRPPSTMHWALSSDSQDRPGRHLVLILTGNVTVLPSEYEPLGLLDNCSPLT